MRRAAVFGGGGVAGIAWETGVVAGLARSGLALAQADLFVGTSAGAVAGTRLACGADVEELLSQQLQPPADSQERFRPFSQAEADAQNRKLMAKVGGDLLQARQRIGAFARRSPTPTVAERRAIIAARLPRAHWPTRALRLVAVDVDTGLRRVFDAASHCPLVDAVAASCAVPGVWPVVEIDGRGYMDGGIESMNNAWAAAGAELVIVLAPLGWSQHNPVSGHLLAEVRTLQEGGATVHVILPDAASQEAMGDNVLDPARSSASAAAGLRQGLRLAPELNQWWNG